MEVNEMMENDELMLGTEDVPIDEVSSVIGSVKTSRIMIVRKKDVIRALHNEMLRPEFNRSFFNFKVRGVIGEYITGKPIAKIGERFILFEDQSDKVLKKYEICKLEFECKIR